MFLASLHLFEQPRHVNIWCCPRNPPVRYSCCWYCSCRCRCARRVVVLAQLSAIWLAICMVGGTFLACLHLFQRPRRPGSAGVMFFLLLLFLPMLLRKARSSPRTVVSQFARNLYDRRYIPCLSPSLSTAAAPWRNWFDAPVRYSYECQ